MPGGGGVLQLLRVRVCVHACVLVRALAVAVLLLNGGVCGTIFMIGYGGVAE